MNYFINFLNSNFFVASVGFLGIYLYFKQKGDRKREAARLILQEIRYAEQQIRNANKSGIKSSYALSSKLLPTNSWNDNIHLFLKNLEQSEIDLISSFYARAAYVDKLIQKISDFKNSPKEGTISVPLPSGSGPMEPIIPSSSRPTVEIPVDPMAECQAILRIVSNDIEFVYNTPAGEKLKIISVKNWYHIF